MTQPHYHITGIGNAIVDILAHVEDSFLTVHSMEKGNMALVDAVVIEQLSRQLKESRQCSGGSVANTIAALADMDISCGFLGRVADDTLGEIFTHDIRKVGVDFSPVPAREGKPTACCVVCVTPDGERTMNTFIGASAEFTPSDINHQMIERSDIIYIEGYLWDAEPAKAAITHAISIARANQVKIAFSLSDTFCVDRHREEFIELINGHIDVVFANQDEIMSLYLTSTASQAAERLAAHTTTFAITCGGKPAIIGHEGRIHHVSALAIDRVEDATGAGDLFAAGFLYGMIHHMEITECAKIGHKLAGHIITQLGARSHVSLHNILSRKAA